MHPAVEAELQRFLRNINWGAGISNSFDSKACVGMFRRLRAGAIDFDPKEIRRWLNDDGRLLPREARAVGAMAARFATGKRESHP